MFNTDIIFKRRTRLKLFVVVALLFFVSLIASSQVGDIKWSTDGNSYHRVEKNELVQYILPDNKPVVILSTQ